MVELRVKSSLSVLLISGARNLASQCEEIEAAEADLDWPQPRQHDNLGYAAAAVITSAAALEAAINEIYLRAVDGDGNAFPLLKVDQIDVLAHLWDVVQSSTSVVKKHQIALAATQRPDIDAGTEPAQSASDLIALRNAIVHFKPEWDNELKVHATLEERLNGRFELNNLSRRATGQMRWFPSKCLGAGCARWACETATAYHLAFAEALGVAPHFPQQ